MNKKTTFAAIEANGQQRGIENWRKADILLLVETLRSSRMDLYVELQIQLAVGYRQMNLDGIQCEEPPPYGYSGGGASVSRSAASFKSTLTLEQLDTLAELANEFSVFVSPVPVTKEMLSAFFQCTQVGIRVHNLRLQCAIMSALSNYGHIGRYWQAPIYKYKLLLAYEKDGYINRSDLTTANHAVNNVLMDERIAKIVKTIRNSQVVDGEMLEDQWFVFTPKSVNTAYLMFDFTIDGIDYSVQSTKGVKFESGKRYIYNVTINNHKVEVSQVDIQPWEDGDNEDVTVKD